jgi:hypothetical protein
MNKFLDSHGGINLEDGSTDIYAASLGASSLDANMPVKSNSSRQLVSSLLNTSDVVGLHTSLTNTGVKLQHQDADIDGTYFSTVNPAKRMKITESTIETDDVIMNIASGGDILLSTPVKIDIVSPYIVLDASSEIIARGDINPDLPNTRHIGRVDNRFTDIHANNVKIYTNPSTNEDATHKQYVDTVRGVLPSMRMAGYDFDEVKKHLINISAPNVYSETLVNFDNHSLAMETEAYIGGSYSPNENRVYLTPYSQASQSRWHFINCKSNKYVAYTHGATVVDYAYFSSVYSPSQDRIYFIPSGQSNQTIWHYIDCEDGSVVSYTHGATTVQNAYNGGVYSPLQNRIYLVPFSQSNETLWHYIDCDDGLVVSYAHGVTAVHNAYRGGVYSPTQNRIYFVPLLQGNQISWHYINCDDGSVVTYTHSAIVGSNAYSNGVYSPTQNRIYFIPFSQSNETSWHYINCNDGLVVAYAHGATAVNNAYSGGVLSPTQNRIYFAPLLQAPQTLWHYIDCNDGSVVGYTHGTSAVSSAYNECVYSPLENNIHLVPYVQAPEGMRHTLLPLTTPSVSISFASSTLMGN